MEFVATALVCITELVVYGQSPKIYACTQAAFFRQMSFIIYSMSLSILHHLVSFVMYLFTIQ